MPPTSAQIKAVEALVHESVQTVDALAPAQLHAVLPALKQARDELRADLAKWMQDHPNGGEAFTAFQKKQALLALESTFARIKELHPAMAGALASARRETGGLAAKNLEHEVQRLSSIFDGGMLTIPQIDTAAIVAQGNKLLWKRHETSAKRYAGGIGDDIRVRMSVSLAKGDTFEQMVQRLRGSPSFRVAVKANDPGAAAHGVADAMFHRWRHWADRLVRTENMHAYNTQHDLAIEHVNANRSDDDEEYLRRWDATADKVTCPLCRELDRTVATIKGEFKGGIKSPPRHPYCRCVVLAWLARWGHIKGETPAAEVFEDQGESKRRAQASIEAKAAAKEDLAAFDTHTAKEKAKQTEFAEKLKIAKEKQAKALAEHKAKMAAQLEAEQQKQAQLAAAAKAKLEAAALEAAKKAAEAAAAAAQKQAELLAQKQAKAKAKKIAKLEATAAKFDPETSGTIGYIPKGKAKGKEHLLSKPGMVQTDAGTIKGHG